jgi:hypothetical protein
MIPHAKLSEIPSLFFKEGWLRRVLCGADGVVRIKNHGVCERTNRGRCLSFTKERIPLALTILFLLTVSPLQAQDVRVVNIPNPMTVHTWFIIGAVGAFLIWSISYALQLQKEAVARRKDRGDLLQQKEELLDKIADLETQKESGAIADARYKHELKELRFRLSRVLEKIANPEAQKSAKKTS